MALMMAGRTGNIMEPVDAFTRCSEHTAGRPVALAHCTVMTVDHNIYAAAVYLHQSVWL